MLPIDPALEDAAVGAATRALDAAGVADVDRAEMVRVSLSAWKESHALPDILRATAKAAIADGNLEFGSELSAAWPKLVTHLTRSHVMSLEEALGFLSHLRLVMHLARREQMSASQIARLVTALDGRLSVTWREVQKALVSLKARPVVSAHDVIALWNADTEIELDVLADADLATAAAEVSRMCAGLGFPVPLEPLLLRLFPVEAKPFTPHLQILHYQCVLAEFYDHAVATLYEFAPRGAAARCLFQRYPKAIAPAANPFLNNAKAVDQLDTAWAMSRKGVTGSARALVQVITGMEAMGFAARKEAASWLRWWLHRGLRLQVAPATQLPAAPNAAGVAAVLASVGETETATAGVIEQRIVDAIASTRHLPEHGWRDRGLGESVNASNISRRKLGDCDFQHAVNRRVIAYEAHAGVLTTVYLDGHLQSLRRILPLRAAEWIGISDVDEWSVTVTFVAHSFGPGVTEVEGWVEEEFGIPVDLEYLKFADMIASIEPVDLRDAFGDLVHAPLNQRRTPERVRAKYSELYKV